MEQWRRVDRVGDLQDTTPRPSEGGPPARYFGPQASRSGIGLSKERSILSMPRMLPDNRAFAREGYRNFKCSGFDTSRKSLLSVL